MKYRKTCLALIAIFFWLHACTLKYYQKKGRIHPSVFYEKIRFVKANGLILIEGNIYGEKKNFIFDTGAALTILHSDSLTGKKVMVSNTYQDHSQMNLGMSPSLFVQGVEFSDNYAMFHPMNHFDSIFPAFGGLVGQPIINKANWLINFSADSIIFSNKSIVREGFCSTNLNYIKGRPFAYLEWNDKQYKVLIDLGSSSALKVPKNSKFGKALQEKIKFNRKRATRLSILGYQQEEKWIGQVSDLQLGGCVFHEVEVSLVNANYAIIGVDFFKQRTIYFNNVGRKYLSVKF